VTLIGEDVDLYKLPIPMSSIYDGGPMITAGVVIARDPELASIPESTVFIVKRRASPASTSSRPTTCGCSPSGRSKGTSRCRSRSPIGTHPIEITGSGYRAPLGVDEMAIAGGIRGEAVALAPCQTIDLPYIADAEIVLEAEIRRPAGPGPKAASASLRG